MDYDVNKAKQLIEKETNFNSKKAETMAERIENLHPALEPVVKAWLDGNKPNFSFKGISMSQIMEKERCSYISAIFSMSVLIKNPEFVEKYPSRTFYRE